jgi:S1-C subfamily serine protease
MEATMKHWMAAALVAGALGGIALPASAQEDDASVAKRLADAQRRLEDAAREVAELSGEAAGGVGMRRFDYSVGNPRRAMLGVNLGGAEPNGGGVRVDGVSPGGPAAEAGVRVGDVIVAIQARPVATGRELVRAMEAIEPGEKVPLRLQRDGRPVEVWVEARGFDHPLFIGTNAGTWSRGLPAPVVMPFEHGEHWLLDGWGEAELVTLTPGLGRYFGADKGVLVARAPGDTVPGLQDGDVIVSIGGREPQSGSHAMRILRSYQPGEKVELRILRDRKALAVSVEIPASGASNVLRGTTAPRPARPPAPPAPPTPPSAGRTAGAP